jgi:hypothetical protein
MLASGRSNVACGQAKERSGVLQLAEVWLRKHVNEAEETKSCKNTRKEWNEREVWRRDATDGFKNRAPNLFQASNLRNMRRPLHCSA